MKEFPMTFDEFVRRFSTEQDCLDYLFELRWGNGFVCPKCGHAEYWIVNRVLCTCKECRHQASVLAGTIFQDTRKPLKSWFTAIWWITTQKYGASAQGLQQILGLKSYQTAWAWLHKIRTAMVNPDRAKLSGRVEVDEGYIGGKEEGGKPGRGTRNKALIMIAVELKDNAPGRIRIAVIEDASGKSLIGFVKEHVSPGSHVVTDGWIGYSDLAASGYQHTVYNQSQATNEDEMLPHVHLVISLLKRWLLGTHQGAVRAKHLQAYLDEYVFRFNRRTSAKRGLLFYRLLENAVNISPTTYGELVRKT